MLHAFQESTKATRKAIPLAKGGTVDEVLYGWGKRLDKEERKELKGSRSYQYTDPVPGALLSADWSELTPSQVRLLERLLEELTRAPRVKGTVSSERPDGARLYTKHSKLKIAPGKVETCSFLKESQEYVCFGGNGKRPAGGYTIGGTASQATPGVRGARRSGWLDKAEYFEVRPGPGGSKQALKLFIGDLRRVVVDMLGGVAACYLRGTLLSLGEVALMAEGGSWQDALKVNVRPFAPADYQARIEEYAKEKGGFSAIPRTQAELDTAVREQTAAAGGISPADLKLELGRRGIKHAEFAEKLEVHKSFLSNIFAGRKPLPEALQAKARELLDAWEPPPEEPASN